MVFGSSASWNPGHYLHRCTGCTGFFSGNGWLEFLGIRKPEPDHRPNRDLVQEPFVLLILCILCIHVQKISIPRRRPESPTASAFAWRLGDSPQGGSDTWYSPQSSRWGVNSTPRKGISAAWAAPLEGQLATPSRTAVPLQNYANHPPLVRLRAVHPLHRRRGSTILCRVIRKPVFPLGSGGDMSVGKRLKILPFPHRLW